MKSQGPKRLSEILGLWLPRFARPDPMALARSQVLEALNQEDRRNPASTPLSGGGFEQLGAGAHARQQAQECGPAFFVVAKLVQRRFDRGIYPDCILFSLCSAKILVVWFVRKIAKVEFHRVLPRHNAAYIGSGMVNPPRAAFHHGQIASDADMTRSDRITAEGESAHATFTDRLILRGG